MSEREEMRKLIDVIERGVMSASVEQNIEDTVALPCNGWPMTLFS